MWDPGLPVLDGATIALVVTVCFIAAAVSGMSGFGAGLIITLFITPIIGPKAVIPVLSVTMLITNASRIWFFRSALAWRSILPVVATAVPAAVAGSMVYARLDSAEVQVLLGLVLIAAVPLRHVIHRLKIVPGRKSLLVFGGGYGFLSSVMVGAGILVIPMLLGTGLTGAALLASDATIAVAVNATKMATFGTLEALTGPLFVIALIMGLCTIPGTWLAARIVAMTDIRIHTALVETLIVAGGVWMVWSVLAA